MKLKILVIKKILILQFLPGILKSKAEQIFQQKLRVKKDLKWKRDMIKRGAERRYGGIDIETEQDFMVFHHPPSPPRSCPQLDFCLWKNFSQK